MSHITYRPTWAGVEGGGVSVFNFDDAAGTDGATAAAVRTFFDALKGLIPDNVTITFPNEMKVYDVDGNLTGIRTLTAPSAVSGASSLSYAAGVGVCVRWDASLIVSGRRLKGRTFVVPTVGALFSTNGTVEPVTQTQINTAAAALIAAGASTASPLIVWSSTHAVESHVTVGSCIANPAVLRGRR